MLFLKKLKLNVYIIYYYHETLAQLVISCHLDLKKTGSKAKLVNKPSNKTQL